MLVLLLEQIEILEKQIKNNNPEIFRPEFMESNWKSETPSLFKNDGVSFKTILDDNYQKQEAEMVMMGSRCEIIIGGHRGEIQYVGKIRDLGLGYFIGVKLDEPYGNSDGTLGNVKYFNCRRNYGQFLRLDEVRIGDYPEISLEDELEDDNN